MSRLRVVLNISSFISTGAGVGAVTGLVVSWLTTGSVQPELLGGFTIVGVGGGGVTVAIPRFRKNIFGSTSEPVNAKEWLGESNTGAVHMSLDEFTKIWEKGVIGINERLEEITMEMHKSSVANADMMASMITNLHSQQDDYSRLADRLERLATLLERQIEEQAYSRASIANMTQWIYDRVTPQPERVNLTTAPDTPLLGLGQAYLNLGLIATEKSDLQAAELHYRAAIEVFSQALERRAQ
jgi:hypothetical protein